MTIKELFEELQELPIDTEVCCSYYDVFGHKHLVPVNKVDYNKRNEEVELIN